MGTPMIRSVLPHAAAFLPALSVPTAGPPAQVTDPLRGPHAGGAGPRAAARRWCPTRAARVTLLIAGVVAFSIADLYMTLLHVTGAGFAEANPIARAVIAQGSPELLAAWKIMSMLPAVIILMMLRQRASAEVGAWVALAVLLGVAAQWNEYHQYTDVLAGSLGHLEAGTDQRWIAMAR